MILKSFGRSRGVWVGLGRQSERTAPITKAWLTTVLPPYLHGVGLNLSVARWSLRLGVYKAIARYVSDDYDDDVDVEGELSALGWGLTEDSPEVISTWDSSANETETSTPLT